MSAYIRKMAIDEYYIKVDFVELIKIIRLVSYENNGINELDHFADVSKMVESGYDFKLCGRIM